MSIIFPPLFVVGSVAKWAGTVPHRSTGSVSSNNRGPAHITKSRVCGLVKVAGRTGSRMTEEGQRGFRAGAAALRANDTSTPAEPGELTAGPLQWTFFPPWPRGSPAPGLPRGSQGPSGSRTTAGRAGRPAPVRPVSRSGHSRPRKPPGRVIDHAPARRPLMPRGADPGPWPLAGEGLAGCTGTTVRRPRTLAGFGSLGPSGRSAAKAPSQGSGVVTDRFQAVR